MGFVGCCEPIIWAPFGQGLRVKDACGVWLLPLPPPLPAGMSSQQLLLWDVTKHGLCPFNFFFKRRN